ncbi:MAG: flagellar filament capping protein FliD [Ruminiclostridium sp.]|nr:flagellar filament capping protein FliD [Ruminiclostridium sp.]
MAQPLRMGGLNSGLDTESIINALTANSKLKITKQERQLLKYKATQEAYRDVISKLQNVQKKYFDILNKKTNLKGSTMWSQFSSKTIVDGVEKNIAGLNVSTSINSVAGSYKVKVNNTATQSKLRGTSLSAGATLDMDQFADGGDYGMTVTVGDETKNISFKGGASEADTLSNINEALSEAFGESNASAAGAAQGLVYVDNSGKFVSRAGKGITVSGVGTMESTASLDLSNIKSGNNSISVRVGDEVINLSFQTIEEGYFDEIFDDNGEVKTDLTEAQKAKADLYEQVKADYIEKQKYDEYLAWKDTATDEDKALLKENAFAKASEEHRKEYLDKYLSKEYISYTENLAEGETQLNFEDWKSAEFVDGDMDNELYAGFHDYYYDKTELSDEQIAKRDAELETYFNEKYEAYAGEAGDEALSLEDWKAANNVEGTDLYKGAQAISDKYQPEQGYELDKALWEGAKYNEYEAYKDQLGTVTDENVTFTNDDIVDHYNETSLNNSIGAAETKGGIKLSVAVEGDNATITAADKDGNEVNVSVTASMGSANNFGAVEAKNSISQISNSTVLSDLGLTADANGKYNFKINGVDFSFTADTNVKDMMRTVNASDAGVKMSYSSLDNAFTVTSSEYGVNSEITVEDGGEGLLSALGLSAGATYTKGTNLEVEINGTILESDGNKIEADGTTFTFTGVEAGSEFDVEVSKDNSAVAETLKEFVEDYNKLIEEVYKYLDEEPDDDYYFLADQDKEDLQLSEKQEEKWEEKAKLGLLYHDSTISSVMSKLRVSLMGSIEAADGSTLSLATLGITTATDYKEHGKLVLDEEKLASAIEEYGDDISRLFSDKENGIMVKFDEALESAVGTTGDKGTLINKAGLATGSSSTDNYIYDQMKRITSKISSLETRYESEQSRLWKKYSAMESMLANLNNQQSSFMSYFGGTY